VLRGGAQHVGHAIRFSGVQQEMGKGEASHRLAEALPNQAAARIARAERCDDGNLGQVVVVGPPAVAVVGELEACGGFTSEQARRTADVMPGVGGVLVGAAMAEVGLGEFDLDEGDQPVARR
jgi:hypothetical protein